MSDSDLTQTELRLSSLLLSTGQPQEGSLKQPDDDKNVRDIRDVFHHGEHPNNNCQDILSTPKFLSPAQFRAAVRSGTFTTPTNGICPGYMQCNLIVLEEQYAFDFLLFCQKNKQTCPLIEVLDVGSVEAECGRGSDLRTDVPK
jgi:hypothetical protein